MVFSIQKAMNRGTSTPCVARTVLQTSDLLNAFFVTEPQKQRVLDLSYEVMTHQLACLDVVENVLPQIADGVKQVNAGLESHGKGHALQLPSVINLRKQVESFLSSGKQSLRDTGRLFEIFHGQEFDHRYDRAREWASETFGPDSDLARHLAADADWVERLIRWRNAAEHPRDDRGPLEVRDFTLLGRAPSGEPLVAPPMLRQGTEAPVPIKDFLEVTQDNLLTFFEDVLLDMLLPLPHPLGVTIVEIPEAERDRTIPVRLVAKLGGLPKPSEDKPGPVRGT